MPFLRRLLDRNGTGSGFSGIGLAIRFASHGDFQGARRLHQPSVNEMDVSDLLDHQHLRRIRRAQPLIAAFNALLVLPTIGHDHKTRSHDPTRFRTNGRHADAECDFAWGWSRGRAVLLCTPIQRKDHRL